MTREVTRHVVNVGGIEINGESVVRATVIEYAGPWDDVTVGEIVTAAVRDAATAIYQRGVRDAIPVATEAGRTAGKDEGLRIAAALAAPMAEVRMTLAELTAEMHRPRVKTVVRGADGQLASVIESPA